MLAQSPEPEATSADDNPDRIGIWKCWFLRKGENRSTRRKTSVDVATSGAQLSSGAHNVINDNEAGFSSVSPFVLTFWRVTARSDSTVILLRWKFDPYQLFWYQLGRVVRKGPGRHDTWFRVICIWNHLLKMAAVIGFSFKEGFLWFQLLFPDFYPFHHVIWGMKWAKSLKLKMDKIGRPSPFRMTRPNN